MPPAAEPSPRHLVRVWTVVLCLLGLAAVGVSALDLSAYGMAHHLNSDFLTPYFFCSELLSGRYPMSGWTLSASPYFVPDHLLLGGLLAGFGRTGLAYALFTPVFYAALFVLAGFCVKNTVGRTGPALLAGLLFGNGLLALRALPGHALCLWWIGAPCCHGGVLLLGFGYCGRWGWDCAAETSDGCRPGCSLLGLAGMLSDSLFLFQIAAARERRAFSLPAVASGSSRGGGVGRECAAWRRCSARNFSSRSARRPGWFYFSRIIRTAPTPANQWHTLGRFVADLPPLVRDNWGFALLLAGRGSVFVARREGGTVRRSQ